jgi:hypothetical protein
MPATVNQIKNKKKPYQAQPSLDLGLALQPLRAAAVVGRPDLALPWWSRTIALLLGSIAAVVKPH